MSGNSPEPTPTREKRTIAEKVLAKVFTPEAAAAHALGGIGKIYDNWKKTRPNFNREDLPLYQQEELKAIALRAKELRYLAERKVEAIADPSKRYKVSGKSEPILEQPSSTNSYKKLTGKEVFGVVDGQKQPGKEDEADAAAETVAEKLYEGLSKIPSTVNSDEAFDKAIDKMSSVLKTHLDGVKDTTGVAVIKMIERSDQGGRKFALVGNAGEAKVFLKEKDGTLQPIHTDRSDNSSVMSYVVDPGQSIELENQNGTKALTIELIDVLKDDIAAAKKKYEEQLTTRGETLLTPIDVVLQEAFQQIAHEGLLRDEFISYFNAKFSAGYEMSEEDRSYWNKAGAADWLDEAENKLIKPSEEQILEKQAGKTAQKWRDAYRAYFDSGKVDVLQADKPDQIAALKLLFHELSSDGEYQKLRKALEDAERRRNTALRELKRLQSSLFTDQDDLDHAQDNLNNAEVAWQQAQANFKQNADRLENERKHRIDKLRVWLRAMAKRDKKAAEQYAQVNDDIEAWMENVDKNTTADTLGYQTSELVLDQTIDSAELRLAQLKAAAKKENKAVTTEQCEALVYADLAGVLADKVLVAELLTLVQRFTEKLDSKSLNPAIETLAKRLSLPPAVLVEIVLQQRDAFQAQATHEEINSRDSKKELKKSAAFVGLSGVAMAMAAKAVPGASLLSFSTAMVRLGDTLKTAHEQHGKRSKIAHHNNEALVKSVLHVSGKDYSSMNDKEPAKRILEHLAAAVTVAKREQLNSLVTPQALAATMYENLKQVNPTIKALAEARKTAQEAYNKAKKKESPDPAAVKAAFMVLEQAQNALELAAEPLRRLAKAQASLVEIEKKSKTFEHGIPFLANTNRYIREAVIDPFTGLVGIDTERLRSMTTLVTFTTLGMVVAKEVPGVRVALAAYSGARIGYAVGQHLERKREAKIPDAEKRVLSAQDLEAINASEAKLTTDIDAETTGFKQKMLTDAMAINTQFLIDKDANAANTKLNEVYERLKSYTNVGMDFNQLNADLAKLEGELNDGSLRYEDYIAQFIDCKIRYYQAEVDRTVAAKKAELKKAEAERVYSHLDKLSVPAANARLKLSDAMFKRTQPAEYLKLKELVNSYDQKMQMANASRAINGIEDQRWQLNDGLFKRWSSEARKLGFATLGAVAGGILGEALVQHAAQKVEAAHEAAVPGTASAPDAAPTATGDGVVTPRTINAEIPAPTSSANAFQIESPAATTHGNVTHINLREILTNPVDIRHATVHKGEGVFAALDHAHMSQAEKLHLLETTKINVNGHDVAIFDRASNSQLGVAKAEDLVVVPVTDHGQTTLHFYDKATGNEITGSELGKHFYQMDLQGHPIHSSSHEVLAGQHNGSAHFSEQPASTSNHSNEPAVVNPEIRPTEMTHDQFIQKYLQDHGYDGHGRTELTHHMHGGLGHTLNQDSRLRAEAEVAWQRYDDDWHHGQVAAPTETATQIRVGAGQANSNESGGAIGQKVSEQIVSGKAERVTLPPPAPESVPVVAQSVTLEGYKNNPGDFARFKDAITSSFGEHNRFKTDNNLVFVQRADGIYVDIPSNGQPAVRLDESMYHAIEIAYRGEGKVPAIIRNDKKFEGWMWQGIIDKAEELRKAAGGNS